MSELIFRFEDGKEIRAAAAEGEMILTVAKRAGVDIDAPCNGSGTCGKCRVRLLEGEAESAPGRHISEEDRDAGWTLACQTKVQGDVTLLVPESAAAYRSGIRTADLNDPTVQNTYEDSLRRLREQGLLNMPAILPRTVTMDAPGPDDTLPDRDRLLNAIWKDTGLRASMTLPAVRKLASALREGDYTVTAVLERSTGTETQIGAETLPLNTRVLDLYPGRQTPACCGLAIDIGTTTVTAALLDLEDGKLLSKASAGNGQIRYGADVINRIIESTRPGGKARLKTAVINDTLVPMIRRICRETGIPADRIYRVCIAGNTTMNHLLLGVDADPIRLEPFIPSFFELENLRAADVIPGLNPEARLVMAPNVGSYAGGDITAGVLASGLWNQEENTLFIDLGTNGELVIGNSDYMMCCACSAGPAFEGGDISCGMRATDGAIEQMKIDPVTLAPHITVIGEKGQKPLGLCGSGLIDTVAELFRSGIISAKGKLLPPERRDDPVQREELSRRICFDEHGMGRYVLASRSESGDGREISLDEADLDNFIRAKGAIFSAIRLMISQLGMEPSEVDRILIAGGIGSGINFENAITIGMFPKIPAERFSYIGNSSLTGSAAMTLSLDAEEKTLQLARNMTYVELSAEPGYMDEFVAACFLPHTDSSLF